MPDDRNLVILRVDGGICSQIGFVALGVFLSRRYGVHVKYDLSWYRTNGRDCDGNLVRNWDFPKAFPSVRIDEASEPEIAAVARKHTRRDFDLADFRTPLYFTGYGNRDAALWEVREWIRSRFEPEVDVATERLSDRMTAVPTCAVHIRRGDLSRSSAVYGNPTSVGYFSKAMRIIAGLAPGVRFCLFSDDPDWARANVIPVVPAGCSCELVEGNGSDRGYLDLYLISRCAYIISSSGSFGFFGAVLSARCRELVVSRIRNGCFANLPHVIYLNDDRSRLRSDQERLACHQPPFRTNFRYRFHLFRLRIGKAFGRVDAAEFARRRERLAERYLSVEDRLFRRLTFGNAYSDRKFLVIRRRSRMVGLLSHFITDLGWIRYGLEHGYVPVVDMQTTDNMYVGDGSENPWERFFQQPCGYGMNEVREARNVFVVDEMPSEVGFPDDRMSFVSDGSLKRWHDLVDRRCRVTPSVMDAVRRFEREMFAEAPSEVLGVLARGTDYVAMKPSGHPVQPDAETLIADARAILEAGRCRLVYLVTEDSDILARFRIEFGDSLRVAPQRQVPYVGTGWIADAPGVRGDLGRAMDYLISIVILSRCKSILAGRVSGAVAAALFSPGFAEACYYDLGRY